MRRFLSSVLICAALAGGGCDVSRTEMLLVIDNAGLEIPREIDGLALEVRDMRDQLVFQLPQPIRPCRDGESPGTSPKCYQFPIVVKVIPGERAPTDQVRLRLDAVRGAARVLANTAVFYFAKGRTLRLDVTLYPECLGNLSCAEQNKLCAKNMMCVDAMATEVNPGTTDLAKRPPADLGPPDLSVPPDLALPANADFTAVPNDLAPRPFDLAGVDLVGCVPVCGNRQCGPNGCGGFCGAGCTSTPQQPEECNPDGQCRSCGARDQICCGGTDCANSGLRCVSGFCADVCGNYGELCCMGGLCNDPYVCTTGSPARCDFPPPPDMAGVDMTPCGGPGESCCPGALCTTTNYFCNGQSICQFDLGGMDMSFMNDMQACGFAGGPCCPIVPGPECVDLLYACVGGMCQPDIMGRDMKVGTGSF